MHHPTTALLLLSLCSVAAPAMADSESPPTIAARNHPPEFANCPTLSPPGAQRLGETSQVLRVGRSYVVTVTGRDPDGDPLTYYVQAPPSGASFDAERGTLTWNPTREQTGVHDLRFTVTDGQATAEYILTLRVRQNEPPHESGETKTFYAVGSRTDSGSRHVAVDNDRDPLTVRLLKAPQGARLDTEGRGQVRLDWVPTAEDVGEHPLSFMVSDGELTTIIDKMLVVFPEWGEDDWSRALVPGAGPSLFFTHDGQSLVGGAFDATIYVHRRRAYKGYTCSHELTRDDCHASHRRVYAEFEVLDSLRRRAPTTFTYAAGFSSSFEWYPARRYLIPHWGVETGGLVNHDLGHRVRVRPYFGVHLWAGQQFWLNAAFGYRLTPTELDGLSGPTLVLRAILNPW